VDYPEYGFGDNDISALPDRRFGFSSTSLNAVMGASFDFLDAKMSAEDNISGSSQWNSGLTYFPGDIVSYNPPSGLANIDDLTNWTETFNLIGFPSLAMCKKEVGAAKTYPSSASNANGSWNSERTPWYGSESGEINEYWVKYDSQINRPNSSLASIYKYFSEKKFEIKKFAHNSSYQGQTNLAGQPVQREAGRIRMADFTGSSNIFGHLLVKFAKPLKRYSRDKCRSWYSGASSESGPYQDGGYDIFIYTKTLRKDHGGQPRLAVTFGRTTKLSSYSSTSGISTYSTSQISRSDINRYLQGILNPNNINTDLASEGDLLHFQYRDLTPFFYMRRGYVHARRRGGVHPGSNKGSTQLGKYIMMVEDVLSRQRIEFVTPQIFSNGNMYVGGHGALGSMSLDHGQPKTNVDYDYELESSTQDQALTKLLSIKTITGSASVSGDNPCHYLILGNKLGRADQIENEGKKFINSHVDAAFLPILKRTDEMSDSEFSAALGLLQTGFKGFDGSKFKDLTADGNQVLSTTIDADTSQNLFEAKHFIDLGRSDLQQESIFSLTVDRTGNPQGNVQTLANIPEWNDTKEYSGGNMTRVPREDWWEVTTAIACDAWRQEKVYSEWVSPGNEHNTVYVYQDDGAKIYYKSLKNDNENFFPLHLNLFFKANVSMGASADNDPILNKEKWTRLSILSNTAISPLSMVTQITLYDGWVKIFKSSQTGLSTSPPNNKSGITLGLQWFNSLDGASGLGLMSERLYDIAPWDMEQAENYKVGDLVTLKEKTPTMVDPNSGESLTYQEWAGRYPTDENTNLLDSAEFLFLKADAAVASYCFQCIKDTDSPADPAGVGIVPGIFPKESASETAYFLSNLVEDLQYSRFRGKNLYAETTWLEITENEFTAERIDPNVDPANNDNRGRAYAQYYGLEELDGKFKIRQRDLFGSDNYSYDLTYENYYRIGDAVKMDDNEWRVKIKQFCYVSDATPLLDDNFVLEGNLQNSTVIEGLQYKADISGYVGKKIYEFPVSINSGTMSGFTSNYTLVIRPSEYWQPVARREFDLDRTYPSSEEIAAGVEPQYFLTEGDFDFIHKAEGSSEYAVSEAFNSRLDIFGPRLKTYDASGNNAKFWTPRIKYPTTHMIDTWVGGVPDADSPLFLASLDYVSVNYEDWNVDLRAEGDTLSSGDLPHPLNENNQDEDRHPAIRAFRGWVDSIDSDIDFNLDAGFNLDSRGVGDVNPIKFVKEDESYPPTIELTTEIYTGGNADTGHPNHGAIYDGGEISINSNQTIKLIPQLKGADGNNFTTYSGFISSMSNANVLGRYLRLPINTGDSYSDFGLTYAGIMESPYIRIGEPSQWLSNQAYSADEAVHDGTYVWQADTDIPAGQVPGVSESWVFVRPVEYASRIISESLLDSDSLLGGMNSKIEYQYDEVSHKNSSILKIENNGSNIGLLEQLGDKLQVMPKWKNISGPEGEIAPWTHDQSFDTGDFTKELNILYYARRASSGVQPSLFESMWQRVDEWKNNLPYELGDIVYAKERGVVWNSNEDSGSLPTQNELSQSNDVMVFYSCLDAHNASGEPAGGVSPSAENILDSTHGESEYLLRPFDNMSNIFTNSGLNINISFEMQAVDGQSYMSSTKELTLSLFSNENPGGTQRKDVDLFNYAFNSPTVLRGNLGFVSEFKLGNSFAGLQNTAILPMSVKITNVSGAAPDVDADTYLDVNNAVSKTYAVSAGLGWQNRFMISNNKLYASGMDSSELGYLGISNYKKIDGKPETYYGSNLEWNLDTFGKHNMCAPLKDAQDDELQRVKIYANGTTDTLLDPEPDIDFVRSGGGNTVFITTDKKLYGFGKNENNSLGITDKSFNSSSDDPEDWGDWSHDLIDAEDRFDLLSYANFNHAAGDPIASNKNDPHLAGWATYLTKDHNRANPAPQWERMAWATFPLDWFDKTSAEQDSYLHNNVTWIPEEELYPAGVTPWWASQEQLKIAGRILPWYDNINFWKEGGIECVGFDKPDNRGVPKVVNTHFILNSEDYIPFARQARSGAEGAYDVSFSLDGTSEYAKSLSTMMIKPAWEFYGGTDTDNSATKKREHFVVAGFEGSKERHMAGAAVQNDRGWMVPAWLFPYRDNAEISNKLTSWNGISWPHGKFQNLYPTSQWDDGDRFNTTREWGTPDWNERSWWGHDKKYNGAREAAPWTDNESISWFKEREHLGERWVSIENALPEDEPGISPKWEYIGWPDLDLPYGGSHKNHCVIDYFHDSKTMTVSGTECLALAMYRLKDRANYSYMDRPSQHSLNNNDDNNLRANCLKLAANRNAPAVPFPVKLTDDNVVWASTNEHSTIYVTEDGDVKILGSIIGCKDIPVQGLDFHSEATHGEVRRADNVMFHGGSDTFDSFGDLTVNELWQNDNWGLIHHMTDRDPDPFAGGEAVKYGSLIQGNIAYGETWEPYIEHIDYVNGQYVSYSGSLWSKIGDQGAGAHTFPGVIPGEWNSVSESITPLVTQDAASTNFDNLNNNYLHKYWPNTGPAYVATDSNGLNPDVKRIAEEDWGSIEFFGGNVIRQDGTTISDPSVGIAGSYRKVDLPSPTGGYPVYRHVANVDNLIWFYNGYWRASTATYYNSNEFDKQYAKGAVTTTVDKTPADVAVWSVLTQRESHKEINIYNTGVQFGGQYSSDSKKDTAWSVQPNGVLPATANDPLYPAAWIPNNLIPGNWLDAPEGSSWVGVWWSEQGGVPTLWPQATPVFYQAFHLDEGIDVSQVTVSFDFAVDNTMLDIQIHSEAGWHSINPDLVTGEEWETTSYLTNWDFNKSMLGYAGGNGHQYLFGWRPLFPDNWTANVWLWLEDHPDFVDNNGNPKYTTYWHDHARKSGEQQILPGVTKWGTFWGENNDRDGFGNTATSWFGASGSNLDEELRDHGMHYPAYEQLNQTTHYVAQTLELHLDNHGNRFEYLSNLLDKSYDYSRPNHPTTWDNSNKPSLSDLACMGVYNFAKVVIIQDNCSAWGSRQLGYDTEPGVMRSKYGGANYYWGLQSHVETGGLSGAARLHLVPWGYDYTPNTYGFGGHKDSGSLNPSVNEYVQLGTWNPDKLGGAGFTQWHQGSELSAERYGPNYPKPLTVGQKYEVRFFVSYRTAYSEPDVGAIIWAWEGGVPTATVDNLEAVQGGNLVNDYAGSGHQAIDVGDLGSGWTETKFTFVATHTSHSVEFICHTTSSDSTAFIYSVSCKPVTAAWYGGWFGELNSIDIGPQGIGASNIFRAGAGAAGNNALVMYVKNAGNVNNPAGLLVTNLTINAPLLLGYGAEIWTEDAEVKTEYRIQHRAGNGIGGAAGKLSTDMVTGILPYPLEDYEQKEDYAGYTWYGDQTDWDYYMNVWTDVADAREELYPWMTGEEYAKLHWAGPLTEADRATRYGAIRHKSTLERRTLAKSEWFRNKYVSQTYMRDWVEDPILGHTFLARASQAANNKLTSLGKTGGNWYYTAKYGQWIYITDAEKTKKEDGERFECFMSGIDIDFTEISSNAENYGVGNALFPVIDGEIVGKLAFTGTGTGWRKDSGIFFHIYVRPSSGIVLRTIKPEILTQGRWGVMYSPGKTTDARTAGDWSTIVQTRYGMISYNDHRVVWSILDDGPPDVRAYADGVAGETGTGYDQDKVMAASAWTWPENNGGGHHEDLDPPLVLAQGYHTFYMWEYDWGQPTGWGLLGDEGKFRYLLSAEIGGAAVNEEFHDSGDIVFHAGWILDNDAIYGSNLPGIGSWENHIKYSPRGFSGFFDYTAAAGMGEDPEYQGSTISKSSYNEGDIVTAQVADGDDLFGTLVFVSMKDDNTSDIGFSESLERVDGKKWSMPAPKAITKTYDLSTNSLADIEDEISSTTLTPEPHTLYDHEDYGSDKALQVEAGSDHILIRTASGKVFGVGDNSLQQIDWRNKTGGIESDFDLGDRLGRESGKGFYKLEGTAPSSLNPIYDPSWSAIEQPALPPEKWAYGKTYQPGSRVWIDHVSHVVYVGPGEGVEGTLLQEHLQISIPSITENGGLETLPPETLKSDWADTNKLGKWQKPDVEVLTFGSIGEAMHALVNQENGAGGTLGSTGLSGWFPLGKLGMMPNDGATHTFPSSEIKMPRTANFKLYKKAFGDTHFCTREIFIKPHLISHGNNNNQAVELDEIIAVAASGNNSLILSQSGNLFGTGENKISGSDRDEYEGRSLGNALGLESEFLDGPEFIFPNVEFISLQGDCATFISEGRSYKCGGVGLRPYLENYSFKGAPAVILDDASGREGEPIIAKQVFMDSFGFWSKPKRRIRKWPQFIDGKLCRKGSKDIRDKVLPEINRLADAWVSNKSYRTSLPSGHSQLLNGQPNTLFHHGYGSDMVAGSNADQAGSAFIGREPDFVTHKGTIYQCIKDHFFSFEPGSSLGELYWRESSASMINVNPIQYFYREWQLDRWATISYVNESGELFSKGFQVMYAPDSSGDIIGGKSYTSLRTNASTWADERISGWHLDLDHAGVGVTSQVDYGGSGTMYLYYGGQDNEYLGTAGSIFGESVNPFYGDSNTNIVNEKNLLDTEYIDFTHNLLGSFVSGSNAPTGITVTWTNMLSHVVSLAWGDASCGWGSLDPFAPSFIRDFNFKSWPTAGQLDLIDLFSNASEHGWNNYYFPGVVNHANNSQNPPDGMYNWWQVMGEMSVSQWAPALPTHHPRGALDAFKFMNRFTGDETYSWKPAGSISEVPDMATAGNEGEYHPDIKWPIYSKIERYSEAATDTWGLHSSFGDSLAYTFGYSIFGGNFNDRFNDDAWIVGDFDTTKAESSQFGVKDEPKNPRLTAASGRGSLTKILGLQTGALTQGCPEVIPDSVFSLLLQGHLEYRRINFPSTAMFGAWMCDPWSLPFGDKAHQSWKSQFSLLVGQENQGVGENVSWGWLDPNSNTMTKLGKYHNHGLVGDAISHDNYTFLKPGDRFNFGGTVYRMHWRVEEGQGGIEGGAPIPNGTYIAPDKDGAGAGKTGYSSMWSVDRLEKEHRWRTQIGIMHQTMELGQKWGGDPYKRFLRGYATSIGHSQIYTGFAEKIGGHCALAWADRGDKAGKVSLAVDYRNYSAGLDQRQPDNFSGLGEFDVFDVPGWNQRTSDNKETIELTDTQGYTFINREVPSPTYWQRYLPAGAEQLEGLDAGNGYSVWDWVFALNQLRQGWDWTQRLEVWIGVNFGSYPTFTLAGQVFSSGNQLPHRRQSQGAPHTAPGISNYEHWLAFLAQQGAGSLNRYAGFYKFPQRAVDFGFGPMTDVMEAYGQLKRHGMNNFTIGPDEAHSWRGRENQMDSYCSQSKRSSQYNELAVTDLTNIPVGECMNWLWENDISAGDIISIQDHRSPKRNRRLWRAYNDIPSGTIKYGDFPKAGTKFIQSWWTDLFQEILDWDSSTWYRHGDRVIYKGNLWLMPHDWAKDWGDWGDPATDNYNRGLGIRGDDTMPGTTGVWKSSIEDGAGTKPHWVIGNHHGGPDNQVSDGGTPGDGGCTSHNQGADQNPEKFALYSAKDMIENWKDRPYTARHNRELRFELAERFINAEEIDEYNPLASTIYAPEIIWAKDIELGKRYTVVFPGWDREWVNGELHETIDDWVDEFGEEWEEWTFDLPNGYWPTGAGDSIRQYMLNFASGTSELGLGIGELEHRGDSSFIAKKSGWNVLSADALWYGGQVGHDWGLFNVYNSIMFFHPWRMFDWRPTWGEYGRVSAADWETMTNGLPAMYRPYYASEPGTAAQPAGSGPLGESLYRSAYTNASLPHCAGDVILSDGDLFLAKNCGSHGVGAAWDTCAIYAFWHLGSYEPFPPPSESKSRWQEEYDDKISDGLSPTVLDPIYRNVPGESTMGGAEDHPMMWGDYRIATQADVDAGANSSINTPPTEVGDAFGKVDWSGAKKVTNQFLPDSSNGPMWLGEAYDQPLLRKKSWERLLRKLHPSLQMSGWGFGNNLEPGAWGGCQVRPYSPPGYYRGDLVKTQDGGVWKVWRFNEEGGSASGYGTGDDAPGGANNKWEYIGENGDSLGWLLTGAKGAFYSESYLDSGNKQELTKWYINAEAGSDNILKGSTDIYDSEDVSITCRGSKMFASRDAAINWVIRRAKEREKLGFSWYDHKTRKWVAGRNWLWENINLERIWDYGGWELSEGGKPEGAGDNADIYVTMTPRTQYYPGDRAWWKGELYECQAFLRLNSSDEFTTHLGAGTSYVVGASNPWNAYNPDGRWGGTPVGDSVFPYTNHSLPHVDGEHIPPWWVKSGGGTFKLPVVGFDDYDGSHDNSKHQGAAGVREGSNLAGTMSIFPNDYFDTQEEAEAFARNPQVASNYSDSNTFQPGGPYKGHPGFTDADLIEITTEYCDKYGAAGVDGDCEVIYIGGAAHSQCLARMRGICDSWEEKIGNALPGGTIIPNGELFLSILGSAKWKDSWEDTGNKVDTD